jgi:hypothetical protein
MKVTFGVGVAYSFSTKFDWGKIDGTFIIFWISHTAVAYMTSLQFHCFWTLSLVLFRRPDFVSVFKWNPHSWAQSIYAFRIPIHRHEVVSVNQGQCESLRLTLKSYKETPHTWDPAPKPMRCSRLLLLKAENGRKECHHYRSKFSIRYSVNFSPQANYTYRAVPLIGEVSFNFCG